MFKSRVYFCKPETISDPKKFNDFVNSLVVVDSAEGKHLGYFLSDATGQYYTAQMPNVHEQPTKLVDLTNINWIMPVDWIRP